MMKRHFVAISLLSRSDRKIKKKKKILKIADGWQKTKIHNKYLLFIEWLTTWPDMMVNKIKKKSKCDNIVCLITIQSQIIV